MSPERQSSEGGIPHTRRELSALPGTTPREETWTGANEAKAEKLRVRSLKRRAGSQGFQLRHSAYGYALVDSAHKPIEDRNDLTLAEVEKRVAGIEPA